MSNEQFNWNFPLNHNGEKTGINEAGIETFKGNLYSSLAREICQNSLDAQDDKSKPVHISFSLKQIKTRTLLGYNELSDVIDKCWHFWKAECDKKAITFFKSAQKTIAEDYIKILCISDFNTVGVLGSNEQQNSPWQNLVKSSGVSNKSGDSGGSFGIGKSAPFATSSLRTIFYNTLDKNGLRAYQGVSRLATFKNNQGETTQGKGYYGVINGNSPILGKQFPLLTCQRTECGTDIFIVGFNSCDTWKDEIIKSIIEGYLISIFENKLTIDIDGTLLNKDSLGLLIEKYKDSITRVYDYYQILIDNTSEWINAEIDGMNSVSLKIVARNGLCRKVLMARSNGMKIFDKDRFSTTFQFAGICILRDDVNSYFRAMENPQHNSWEPDRIGDDHSQKKLAEKRKKLLYKYMNTVVKELSKQDICNEMDAVGAGEFIPAIDEVEGQNENDNEAIGDTMKGYTKIEPVQSIPTFKGRQKIGTEDVSDSNFDDNSSEQTQPCIENDGDDDNNFRLGENDLGGHQENDKGSAVTTNDSTHSSNNKNIKVIETKPLKMRLFMYDAKSKLYKLTFTPIQTTKHSYIEISIAGEQSKVGVDIETALSETNEKLNCSNGRINIGTITKDKKYTTYFSIKGKEQYSMEVLVSGYKA